MATSKTQLALTTLAKDLSCVWSDIAALYSRKGKDFRASRIGVLERVVNTKTLEVRTSIEMDKYDQ